VPLPVLGGDVEQQPLLNTAMLDEVQSHALCRDLGDRGFVGTAPSADELLLADGDDPRSTSSFLDRDDEFLLGSMGKVIWEGANRVMGLPRTLAELRSFFLIKYSIKAQNIMVHFNIIIHFNKMHLAVKIFKM